MSFFDDYDTVCSVHNHKHKGIKAYGYSLRTISKTTPKCAQLYKQ